ncbi:MAG TPA: ATP-binding protein [Rhodococcus sp. (in: high G+C Gram-positive bacteria)]|nr:ATP-binding protein [Rhodococcus sp. (in: high G+C Gram-positive bacteria)]
MRQREPVVPEESSHVAAHDGPVIVPMTLVEPDYFDEVMAGLAAENIDIRHFSLVASPETLRRRLQTRTGYWLGRAVGREETWAMQQIPRCVTALATERFAEHVDTDGRAIDEVVEDIAARAGLDLTHDRLPLVRHQLRRAAVGVRHIRM